MHPAARHLPVLRAARPRPYTALLDLLVTAPAALREQLAGRYKGRLLHACQQLIASEIQASPTDAMILAIKSLAARCLNLDAEAAELERTSTRSPPPPHPSCAPSTASARHRRHAAIGDRRQPQPDQQ